MRLGDNSTYKWELGEGSRAVEVDVPGPISANETESAVLAAINGVALTYCLESRVEQELRSGLLEIVLPDWSVMGAPFYMYYPNRRQTPPGLQQLIECLRAEALPVFVPK
jgi:DNA-binding transcriptional LysR family regulator